MSLVSQWELCLFVEAFYYIEWMILGLQPVQMHLCAPVQIHLCAGDYDVGWNFKFA